MKTQDLFYPEAERYDLDFGPCSMKKNFAQVDTGQDASYYGIWANPFKRQIVSFCEGDLHIQNAETDDEFTETIRSIEKFHNKYDEFSGIDTGIDPEETVKTAFQKLGLGDLLYSSERRKKLDERRARLKKKRQ